MKTNFDDVNPLSGFCPRCREKVSRYVNNELKLLFSVGFFRVYCPKCKQDITEECRETFDESFISLVSRSYTGWILLLIFFALGLVMVSVITSKK